MPLKMSDFGPGERPAIFCDGCGEEITDVAEGNYHWSDGQTVYFSHKSNCCWVVDRKFKTPCGMGLEDFF
jgi:hypothetical protein